MYELMIHSSRIPFTGIIHPQKAAKTMLCLNWISLCTEKKLKQDSTNASPVETRRFCAPLRV